MMDETELNTQPELQPPSATEQLTTFQQTSPCKVLLTPYSPHGGTPGMAQTTPWTTVMNALTVTS